MTSRTQTASGWGIAFHNLSGGSFPVVIQADLPSGSTYQSGSLFLPPNGTSPQIPVYYLDPALEGATEIRAQFPSYGDMATYVIPPPSSADRDRVTGLIGIVDLYGGTLPEGWEQDPARYTYSPGSYLLPDATAYLVNGSQGYATSLGPTSGLPPPQAGRLAVYLPPPAYQFTVTRVDDFGCSLLRQVRSGAAQGLPSPTSATTYLRPLMTGRPLPLGPQVLQSFTSRGLVTPPPVEETNTWWYVLAVVVAVILVAAVAGYLILRDLRQTVRESAGRELLVVKPISVYE